MAGDSRMVGCLHRRDGRLAGLYGLQEVPLMILREGQLHLALLLRQLPDLAPGFVGCLKPPAVNPDPAVRSDPFGAAANIGMAARDRHGYVSRVFQFDAIFRAGVPHRVHRWKLALALDLEGAGVIEIATPVGDVAMVPDPVEQLAPARVVVPAPVPVNPAPDVWHH